MTPVISVLLAHKRERENDKALKIALNTLVDNTDVDYEILIRSVAEYQDCYAVYNEMAQYAAGEWLVFHNSDTFVAPRWASEMLKVATPDAIVGCVLVECGAIGTARQNVNVDFGRTPDTFNRAGFEQWAAAQYPQVFQNQGYGDTAADKAGIWYWPCMQHRHAFLESGMYGTAQGWPYPNDIEYFNKWVADGKRLLKAPAFIYHLQAYSVKENQEKRGVIEQPQIRLASAVEPSTGEPDISMLFAGRR
jgi:hypothetical protein